jgi:hypothetical protein
MRYPSREEETGGRARQIVGLVLGCQRVEKVAGMVQRHDDHDEAAERVH